MTCRHSANDPSCSSYYVEPRDYSAAPTPKTPDAEKFTIEDAEQVGAHLVVRARYPNCNSCAYEGNKVMVFLNVTPLDAMKWRRVDPHFRDPKRAHAVTVAPSPAARFPATQEGWQDAVAYARYKEAR